MTEGREDTDVTVETHSLLLSLAGHLDDELLGWCRELAAVGESDYALELVTGSVQADRVHLPERTHDDLLAAASRRQLLGRTEGLPAPDATPRVRHRFFADPTEGGFPVPNPASSPEEALRGVPARLLRDCELRLTWRVTPAGGAPGPLPHPVVLIETLEAAGADVLAYQVGEVLARAGVFASVEVFSADMELGDYHRAALAEANPIDFGEPMVHPGGAARRPEAPDPTRRPADRRPSSPSDSQWPGESAPRRPAEPVREQVRDSGRDVGRDSGRDVGRDVGRDSGRDVGRDPERRPPLRPVDRVITARGSAPLRPRADRADDLAAGLNFDRPVQFPDESDGVEPLDAPPPPPERPSGRNATGGYPPAAERTTALPPASPPAGPAGPPARPANRPPVRPEDLPEPPAGLSDVEQRLLRQLHEELAAREDGDPPSDEPRQSKSGRVFRSANGGGRKPPPRGNGAPPDRAS